MRRAARLAIALLALGPTAACGLVGFGSAPVVVREEPPPRAPAHGYKHAFDRDNVDLVYDSGLGAYVVVDLVDVFFYEGHYYHCEDGRWFISPRPRSGWLLVAASQVPTGLRGYKVKPKK